MNTNIIEKKKIYIYLVLAGAVLFNAMFWQEAFGLNLFLYNLFVLVSIFVLYANARKQVAVRWLLLANAISIAAVLWHNTDLSKLAYFTTLFLLVGYAEYFHRSIWYASSSVLSNVLAALPNLKQLFFRTGNGEKSAFRKKLGKFRMFILPIVLVLFFFLLYVMANKVFADLANRFGTQLEIVWDKVLGWIRFDRILFMLLGLFVTTFLLLRSKHNEFEKAELLKADDLQRKKGNKKFTGFFTDIYITITGRFAKGNLALKNSLLAGTISLMLLNIILLIVNAVDVTYLWLGFSYHAGFEWVGFVHQGAEILVISILLAILVVVGLFKGNINFYAKNVWLKRLALLWIMQNAFLAVSVGLRNYYYITHMGIAYKRIGLFVFVALVLFGLLTVAQKIYLRKTNYYLFRINAWAGLTALVVCACINWDRLIVNYNLSNKDKLIVDVQFLMTLDASTFPVLDAHKDFLALPQNKNQTDYYLRYDVTMLLQQLERRKINFLEEQKKYTWLSWNWADLQTKKYLATQK
jgi:hypothetical protein